jgi:hypothetical protein
MPDASIIDQVDAISEEVRLLALNLAIYLAKAKKGNEELNRLEPDFVSLVNGSIKAVQEVGMIINAARNNEALVYDIPSGNLHRDRLEMKLISILNQCGRILSSLPGHGEQLA